MGGWDPGGFVVYSWGKVASESRPSKNIKNPIKMLQVKVTKMNDLSFKKDLFNPLRTGRKIDEFFSGERGIMPGTNTVITGDPGVGKTTVLLDILGDLNNAGKRVLFVSGEMNQIDMVGYVKRFPKFGDLPILFMGDYADEDPLEVLEMAFEDGYDVVMIDSLAEVAVAIQDYHGGTYKGATSKILTMLEEQNMGENKRGINTSTLLIQQVTKSGSFAGSNRIKHMTTAMGHIKFDGDGGRYIAFSKNRRGGNMNKFYFNLSTKNQVNWMYEAPANGEG
jgi:predicted ATP-dependent serine protease